MADIDVLEASFREDMTKGELRSLRQQGMVPCIIYGDGKDPAKVSMDLRYIVKELHRGGFQGRVYDVQIGDRKQRCLPRDVQLHPVTDDPLHVDFLRLSANARVSVNIPVVFVGEEDSPGLERGGVLNVVRYEVELDCPADAIPEQVELSLAGLEIGDALKISDASLPDGVEPTITDRDFTIATIAAATAVAEEAAEEQAEAEAEAEAEADEEATEGEEGEGAEEGGDAEEGDGDK
ncbi:MAG: 50S ribosomal protein L25/general stress protein Ctc [Minwuia sp.]|uniref:50S ribosomal protein L25/general stress protein Ctc n=1 Tax=Minwuia sp. TaxID=2493630 RepID=UPI003A88FF47